MNAEFEVEVVLTWAIISNPTNSEWPSILSTIQVYLQLSSPEDTGTLFTDYLNESIYLCRSQYPCRYKCSKYQRNKTIAYSNVGASAQACDGGFVLYIDAAPSEAHPTWIAEKIVH